ncbi:fibronectin type III domain-containing protein [Blastococcus sp. SYSU D00813]
MLGAPATELAAEVTASWAPFRDAGTLVDPVPQVPRVPQVPGPGAGIVDPEPQVDVPGVAVPVPRDIDLEIVPPVVPRGVVPEFEPPPATCGGYSSPRRILPGVVPGPGSATLSWMADSDNSAVRGYRVQAVSQQLVTGAQPEPPQVLVGQRDDCGEVGATLTGLTPGAYYAFWLEEQVWDEQSQRMRYLHVGTTDPVLIP